MPIYEYECADCGERIERLQGLNDPPPEACKACGGLMKRMLSAPAFQFKGTGWYVTDYAGRKSSDDDGASASSKAEGEKAKQDSAKKDSTKKDSAKKDSAKKDSSKTAD
jgi:putative FmdB family regulatory protein